MSVLTVGSGKQYATVSAAVAASHDGDTIYVQAGTYLNDFSVIRTQISIIGVGGMAHFDATKAPTNGKAFLVTNTEVKLDHLEFSNAKVADLNGAGVRYQGGGTLTITNSYFHNNQDGILGGGPNPGDDVIIDHSEFAHNGAGDGMSHNLYIAETHSLTVTNSYLHDAVVGHELKSRAQITTILNNRIADFNGSGSYDIDLGKGGNVHIRGNYIQQGPNSQNPAIINFGSTTREPWADSQLVVEDNIIVNQLTTRSAVGLVNRINFTAQMHGNHIFGFAATQIATGLNVQYGNDTLAQPPAIDTSHPWADSPWDKLIWGGAAANVLDGSAGHDLFVGGSGNDTFVIRAGGNSDTIAAFDSAGTDVVRLEGYAFNNFAGITAAMTQNGEDTVLKLGNGETLTFQDKAIGSFTAADFTLSATVSPLPTSTTTSTPSTTISRPKPFKLVDSANPVNAIAGDSNNNLLTGTAQADRIAGHGGADTMAGGAGDDTYVVDGNDTVIEKAGAGIDKVALNSASFTLPDNVEHLALNGASAQVGVGNTLNNIISSGSGNDTMSGGAGNDILKAGTGADLMTGGTGNDMFVFSRLGAKSTITDFHIGQDLIDLSPMMNAAHYVGTDPLADHAIAIVSNGHGGSVISVDPTHTGTLQPLVEVQGVAPDTLYVGMDILWH